MAVVDHDTLLGQLTRLQLTAIRDQLDSLLDEAAEKQLTPREALAFLIERVAQGRTAHRDGVQDCALPGGPRAGGLRLQGATEHRCASGPGAGDITVDRARRRRLAPRASESGLMMHTSLRH